MLHNKHFENVLGEPLLKRPNSAPPQSDELPGSPVTSDFASLFMNSGQPNLPSTLSPDSDNSALLQNGDNRYLLYTLPAPWVPVHIDDSILHELPAKMALMPCCRSFLATPEYLKYYYANKNMNPRLPPPVVASRDQQLRGVWGDKQGEGFGGDAQVHLQH